MFIPAQPPVRGRVPGAAPEGGVFDVPVLAVSAAWSAREISFSTGPRSSASIMATRKRRACSRAPSPHSESAFSILLSRLQELRRHVLDAAGLDGDELARQRLALRREVQQPLAAVGRAGAAVDEALIHQFAQHPAEALLGDAQDVEQVGDAHTRVAIDEMQHTMMCTAEPDTAENLVGITDEVPVGKEEKLDQVDQRLSLRDPCRACRGGTVALGGARWGRDIYVSHVDFFRYDRYRDVPFNERIVRRRPCGPL